MIVMMSTTMKVIDDEDAVDGHVIDDIDETGDDNVNDDEHCAHWAYWAYWAHWNDIFPHSG